MLQRDSKFGLYERVGRDVVMYPLGEMFRGVRLDEYKSNSATSSGRNFVRAAVLIVSWMFALFLIASILTEIGRRDAADWVMTFGATQVFVLLALERPARLFLGAPRATWTPDRPIDRERAGRIIVPPYSIATLVIGAICTAVMAAISYSYWTMPPPRLNDVQTMAKVASTAEFTMLMVGLLARMIWRNVRSASLVRTRGAAECF